MACSAAENVRPVAITVASRAWFSAETPSSAGRRPIAAPGTMRRYGSFISSNTSSGPRSTAIAIGDAMISADSRSRSTVSSARARWASR